MNVGDFVRLTGKYLRNTGQQYSNEGQRAWKVLGFERDWAIVDEVGLVSMFTPEELTVDPSLKWRRIAIANLEVACDGTGIED